MANTFDVYLNRRGILVDGLYNTDTDVDWRLVLKEVMGIIEEYNSRELAGLQSMLAGETVKEKVKTPICAMVAVEHTDGREADITSNAEYEFSLPLVEYEVAASFTRTMQKRCSVDKIAQAIIGAMQAHREKQLQNMLKPMFGKTKPGDEWGGTWNVNTDCPDHQANSFFGSNHTHIFGRDDGTLTLAHLREMEQHIMHHGFGFPGPSGEKRLVLMVSTTQAKELEALADWSATSGLPDNVVQRLSLDGINANAGIGNCFVNVSNFIPEDYVLMFALGTPWPVLTRRVEPRAAYRGLVLETPFENSQFPFRDAQFTFSEGYTVTLPSAMCVMWVGAASNTTQDSTAAYTVPEFYG